MNSCIALKKLFNFFIKAQNNVELHKYWVNQLMQGNK